MVGSNPEVEKRKGLQTALNPSYTTDTTVSGNYIYSTPGEN